MPNPDSLAARLKTTLDSIQDAVVSMDGMRVDYVALEHDSNYVQYRTLVGELNTFDPNTLATREERLAFWINLYNALMIDSVIRLKVKTSIAEGFLGVVRFSDRAHYTVNGYKVSATQLEHGILRGNKNTPFVPWRIFRPNDLRRTWVIDPVEPRIHFALNCASNSCPPIRFYDADRIEQQLEAATRHYLESEVRFEPESHTIWLPMLFSWYGSDFAVNGDIKEGIRQFLGRYFSSTATSNPETNVLNQPDRIQWKYSKYDWGLNRFDSLTAHAVNPPSPYPSPAQEGRE